MPGYFFRPGLVSPAQSSPTVFRDSFGKGSFSPIGNVDYSNKFTPPGPGGDPGEPPNGINGGPSSAAGPQGSAVTTNPLVRARFTPAIVSNPLTIRGTTTNRRGWTSIEVDRPMIVKCVTGLMKGVLYYHPDRQPYNDVDANNSSGHGICYLSGPGRWWIKYAAGQLPDEASPDNQTISLIVHDASDSASASKYLSEPGTHYASQSHVAVTSNTTFTQLIAANILRKALLIQNLTPTVNVRIGFDGLAVGLVGAPAPNGPIGIRLGATTGTSITLSNDTLTKGAVNSVLEVSGGNAEIELVEWV